MRGKVLLMIKPKGIPLEERLVKMLSKLGSFTERKKWNPAPIEAVRELYNEYDGQWFYEPHCELFRGEPIVTYILEDIAENPNFVSEVRKVIGNRNPAESKPGTFRNVIWTEVFGCNPLRGTPDQSKNRTVDNGIHCSDSLENGFIEIEIFYGSLKRARIAKEIGNVNPQHIQQIVEMSEKKKIIVHGTKKYQYLKGIELEGIRPLTPEGGNASYWAAGWRIFKYGDCPIYKGCSYSEDRPSHYRMLVSVTSYEVIEESGIAVPKFVTHEPILIKQRIPRHCISLINIDMINGPKFRELFDKEPLKVGNAGRKVLVEKLYETIKEFIPGETYNVEIKNP